MIDFISIDFAMRLMRRVFKTQRLDPTLISYIVNIVSVTLRIILVVAILGFFGIETTSFAALLAAAGVAIGAAWGGITIQLCGWCIFNYVSSIPSW